MYFFQERDVTILLGELSTQPHQFGTLGRRQIPIGWDPACIGSSPVPNSFGSNPFAEQILVHIQLSGNLGDRAATINHPPSSLHFELRRKRPTSPRHPDILPAGPCVPLSQVSTQTGEAQSSMCSHTIATIAAFVSSCSHDRTASLACH